MSTRMRRWMTSLLLLGFALPSGLVSDRVIAADPQVVVQNDFEDGTTQGWIPRGPVSLASVTEAAHTGTHSLKTTGRTANWNGPSLDVRTLLQKGATYQISGHVRLVTGQPASTLIFTVQRTPVGGTTAFDRVVASPTNGVTDAGWVQLQGQYSYSTDVSELLLYLESSDPTSQYYLDDFSIMLVSAGQSGVTSDFEDNTTQGWRPRIGAEVLTVTSADKHGGTYSLLTTNRQHPYDGPSLDIPGNMQKGLKYNISVWVKLAPGETASDARVSIQRSFQGTTNFDTVVGNTAVTEAQWVNLAASYTLNNDVDALSIYVETASGTASFYIDDFSLTPVLQPPIQTDIPSVYQTLSGYFKIGAAIEPNQLGDIHADLLKMHFNSITAENVMKPGPIEPTEGQFNFAPADALRDFARANNIGMRGHTLVWHNQNPSWLFLDPSGNPMQPTPENKALLLQRLENHIRAVVGRYKDDVYAWDVVNEVIDPAQTDCLRRSTWYTITGLDYITTAFRIAREVAPTAKLFINDYSTTDPQKRTCLYNLVRDLRAQGVPIDGVGHQMHINIENPSATAIEETIQMFEGLGVDQQITELDMSVYTNGTDMYTTVPQEILIKQGYRYKEIFDVFKRHKDHISSVTFWGMADDHTWLKTFPITRLDLPLLFDEQLQAKYAYWGVVDPSHLPVLIQKKDVPKGTPNIDAKADFLWDMLPWIHPQATGTLSASFKTLWDAQYLYVFAQVQDATKDKTDSVDVFIDDNNGKTPVYQADDAHYVIQRNGAHAGNFQASVKKLNDGYLVEAALPLRTPGAIGRQIGFDIRFRDASQPGAPISWNDLTNSQDTDTSKFGTLTLVGAVKSAVAAKGTPVIDGIQDAAWGNAAEITTNTWVQGTSGATARVKTLWDSGHLYIFAIVADTLLSKASANPWEQDSIEVFVDQNNGKTASYQADDGQYRVNYANEQSYGGAASANTFVTATQIVPGGYVVEAAITLNAIQPQTGTLIGFDFQVNDDGQGNGIRSSVVTWNDPTGQSYQNTSRFGVLLFAKQAP
jgi:endo-1,4-beta-xylanase